MQESLAVTMIVRNEEEVLARALDSIVGIADELIIVDTGSTDRTKEIAASYADKIPGVSSGGKTAPGLTILDFEWCDDFSAARNFAIDHATATWILHLDADEELIVDAEDGLKLSEDDAELGRYLQVYPAASREELASATERFVALRLFRNVPWNRFKRRIHEYVPRHEGAEYANSSSIILHFGPSVRPAGESQSHSERNVRLLQMAINDDPGDGALYMHLGRELMRQQEWDASLHYFQGAIQNLPPTSDFIAPILRDTVMCLMSTDRFEDAVAVQEAAEKDFPDYTDLVFLRAKMAEHLLGPEKAAMAYRRCLTMGDPPAHYASWGGTGSSRAEAALQRLGVS